MSNGASYGLGPKPPEINAHDYGQLTQAIGAVTVAMNACQESLMIVFWQLTEMPERAAQAAFRSLKADSAQRDITLAVAIERFEHEKKTPYDANEKEPPLLARIRRSIITLNTLAGERNAAIHTMWEGLMTDKLWPSPFVAKHHGKLDKDDCLAQFKKLEKNLQNEYVTLNDIFVDLACRPPFARESRPQIHPPKANNPAGNPTGSPS